MIQGIAFLVNFWMVEVAVILVGVICIGAGWRLIALCRLEKKPSTTSAIPPPAVDHHTLGDYFTVDEPPESKPPASPPCLNCGISTTILIADGSTYRCDTCGHQFHLAPPPL